MRRPAYREICEIPGNAGLRLDKKRKFHYSRNMVKALNKRSMQEYADRERCTDVGFAGIVFQTILRAVMKWQRSAGWKAFSEIRLQKVA